MDAFSLSRVDLALLAAAVGRDSARFVGMVAEAAVQQNALDLQVRRSGRDYTLVAMVAHGDAIQSEYPFAIRSSSLSEAVHAVVLCLYIEALVRDLDLWRRRVRLPSGSRPSKM